MKTFEKKFLELRAMEENKALGYLDEYVRDNPNDAEAKIKYALFVQGNPFDDYPLSQKLLKEVLDDNSLSVNAVLLKGYLEDIHVGQIKKDTLDLIEKCIQTQADDIFYKQLFVLRAIFYYNNNDELYIQRLRDSIGIDPDASYNHALLARKLKSLGMLSESVKQLKDAINNVKTVYSIDDTKKINPIDLEEFVNEHLRGVNVTHINYTSLKEELNSLES